MKRYKVVDTKGVLFGEKRINKGEFLPPGITGSQLSAWKRFEQVKEVDETPKGKNPESPKTVGEGGGEPPKEPEGGKKPDDPK